MLRSILIFIGIFAVPNLGYQYIRGTVIETLIIDQATVKPGAALINTLQDQFTAKAEGHRIVSDKARLSVLNGCEGTEMLFLIIAAVFSFRCSSCAKLIGLVGGVLLVFVLNQMRIAALFFALIHDPHWFDLIHGYVGPTLIVFVIALCYLYWTRWAQTLVVEQRGQDQRGQSL